MANSFSDQYKHPRWQKKRLEVLEHDSFTCQRCGSKDDQLHVHHSHYIFGRKVWEYDIDELVTFCDECHERVHFVTDGMKFNLNKFCARNYRSRLADENSKAITTDDLFRIMGIIIDEKAFPDIHDLLVSAHTKYYEKIKSELDNKASES